MYFTGIIIAVMTFLAIGLWHPIVIKTDRHNDVLGHRYMASDCHQDRVLLGHSPLGTLSVGGYLLLRGCTLHGKRLSVVVPGGVWRLFLGVFGASALWGIGELFSQKKRVEKGWFPMNPKRKHEYQKNS